MNIKKCTAYALLFLPFSLMAMEQNPEQQRTLYKIFFCCFRQTTTSNQEISSSSSSSSELENVNQQLLQNQNQSTEQVINLPNGFTVENLGNVQQRGHFLRDVCNYYLHELGIAGFGHLRHVLLQVVPIAVVCIVFGIMYTFAVLKIVLSVVGK